MILAHLRKRGMHPYAILKHFNSKRHPFLLDMKKSEIYNAMNSLEDEGFVRYSPLKKGAQLQKRYELTPKGRRILKKSKAIMMKAHEELKELIKSEFE